MCGDNNTEDNRKTQLLKLTLVWRLMQAGYSLVDDIFLQAFTLDDIKAIADRLGYEVLEGDQRERQQNKILFEKKKRSGKVPGRRQHNFRVNKSVPKNKK